MLPLNGTPIILQVIGQLLPTTHMVAVKRGIVLRDAGLWELAPHVATLFAFAAAMIFRRPPRQLDRGPERQAVC